jgi:acid phosphatase
VALAVLVLGTTACGSSSSGGSAAGTSTSRPPSSTSSSTSGSATPSTQANGIPVPAHVVVVIEENHAAGQILGSASAPYLNSLAQSGANFTESFAVTHPSQPNYLALFSGSTQGVTDDSCPPPGSPYAGANLAAGLVAAGKTFTGYSEDLPSAGSTTCGAGDYARKHNPWVDFRNVPASANQPFTAFRSTNDAQLPTVSVVVPNLQHDMHDGTVQQADTWLKQYLGGYVDWAMDHDSLFIVTWDEDDDTATNRIPTIFVGPMVKSGTYATHITHYAVLRTIEDMYGVTPSGAGATAAPITGVWR